MRSWSLWSLITSTRTRVTAATAIAMTFGTVLVTAGDADSAKDVAKKVDTKADSTKKGEAAPSPRNTASCSMNRARSPVTT